MLVRAACQPTRAFAIDSSIYIHTARLLPLRRRAHRAPAQSKECCCAHTHSDSGGKAAHCAAACHDVIGRKHPGDCVCLGAQVICVKEKKSQQARNSAHGGATKEWRSSQGKGEPGRPAACHGMAWPGSPAAAVLKSVGQTCLSRRKHASALQHALGPANGVYPNHKYTEKRAGGTGGVKRNQGKRAPNEKVKGS